MGFTKTISINGTKNLLAEMVTAGYTGAANVENEVTIYNTNGAAAAWLHLTDSRTNAPGIRQVETAVIVGTITVAGDATLTLTASGMTGSPIAVVVPVTVGQTATTLTQLFVRYLSSNVIIAAFFDISYDANNLILTKKATAANDVTLNLAYADTTSAGLTDDATSDNTTAGSLATTSGFPILVSAPSDVFILPQGTDLSTTWLYTAGAVNLVIGVA